ncbi:tRNAHis guanylyltransferase [compost metagenome]
MSKSSRKPDQFGNRMKAYENVNRVYLPKRMPVIIRVDGRAFHTFTRGLTKPFSDELIHVMLETAKYLCENIQGCKLAYHQSDEISLLLTNYDDVNTESWFDNNIQKIVSNSASLATAKFNQLRQEFFPEKPLALFDSRVFVLPKEEVTNYFLWRQQDATKNSVSMVAQANFSQKQLQGLKGPQMQEKLFQEKGINWNNIETWKKRGACVVKKEVVVKEGAIRNRWEIDENIPIFSQDREYIDSLVYPERKIINV